MNHASAATDKRFSNSWHTGLADPDMYYFEQKQSQFDVTYICIFDKSLHKN
ncbi:MAG: hypothetical protein WAO91_08660 [Candidatus Nitrosotenuis sp.]